MDARCLHLQFAKKSLKRVQKAHLLLFPCLQFSKGEKILQGVEEMKNFVISILEDAITSGTLMVLRASKEFAVRTCNALYQPRGCDDGECLRKDDWPSQAGELARVFRVGDSFSRGMPLTGESCGNDGECDQQDPVRHWTYDRLTVYDQTCPVCPCNPEWHQQRLRQGTRSAAAPTPATDGPTEMTFVFRAVFKIDGRERDRRESERPLEYA